MTDLISQNPSNVEVERSEPLPWGTPGEYPALPLRRGWLRSDFTTLTAETDAEAVAVWVGERGRLSRNTAESYRREAERLLLWASSRRKSLSELSREDFLAFENFLLNPQPAENWIAKRRFPRSDPRWRPFMGPLKPASAYQALVIVHGLIKFLLETGWLRANPMPSPRSSERSQSREAFRSLTPRQWHAVKHFVSSMPETGQDKLKKMRLRWLLTLLYSVGPRASEACSHTMNDISTVNTSSGTVWVWEISGKGGKRQLVPLSAVVIEEMKRFRMCLGLPHLPVAGEQVPMVPSLRSAAKSQPEALTSLTRNGLYRLLKTLFCGVAEELQQKGASDDANSLRKASTHWLRHTALRTLLDSSGDLRLVQMMGRHSSIDTSSRYTTAELTKLVAAVNARPVLWESEA